MGGGLEGRKNDGGRGEVYGEEWGEREEEGWYYGV